MLFTIERLFEEPIMKHSVKTILSLTCTAIIISGSAVFLVPQSSQAESQVSSCMGPYDVLGHRLQYCEMLPTRNGENKIYNQEALAVKRKAEAWAVINSSGSQDEAKQEVSTEQLVVAEESNVQENDTEISQSLPQAEQTADTTTKTQTVQNTPMIQTTPATTSSSSTVSETARNAANARAAAARANAAKAAAAISSTPNYLWTLSHPKGGEYKSSIAISGEIIKLVSSPSGVPDDCAGIWKGTGAVNDKKGSYIVGHNPGVFHNLIDKNYGIGYTFTVWDATGKAKVYKIDDVFEVDAGTIYDAALRSRTVFSGGESVTLQTCINDGAQYRIFVAH